MKEQILLWEYKGQRHFAIDPKTKEVVGSTAENDANYFNTSDGKMYASLEAAKQHIQSAFDLKKMA